MSSPVQRSETPVRAAGHDVHAVTWTPDDARRLGPSHPPVLLVPGLGGSSVDWQPAGVLLAGALGTAVTAIDLPGFGRTRLSGRASTVDLFVDVVDDLLSHRGPHVLIGNSMGGLVSVLAAGRRASAVPGIVLADPALPSGERSVRALVASLPFALAMTPLVGPRVLAARKRRLGVERHVASRLAANCHDLECIDREVRDAMVELSRERLAFPEADLAYCTAARSIVRAWARATKVVGELALPGLVVHGRQDRIVSPAVADRLRRLRPDWSVELLDACGHLPHLEAPDRFTQLVVEWSRRAALAPEPPRS